MKLSTRAIYGLRALIDLGRTCEENEAGLVSLQSIAARQDISVSYLEQLMALLKKDGLVESSRGVQGGYRLSRPAGDISVGDVLRALEGGLEAVKCPGIGQGDTACTKKGEDDGAETAGCHGSSSCTARYVWKRINDSISSAVDSLTLGDLIADSAPADIEAPAPATDSKAGNR